ncbi:response regulator [Alteromonas sp. KUL49]|uniref:response regulator n=1 Tax=Alteromonas sp. KUL49 TaxID=2480798 RepID=UPI00102F07A9|nr:response regulator [Alteromonas sp. KUL49]TAP41532.1 response regulator [Alteromonas sp. KUL49]GEA10627.1 DNA-binding response regulator [Alteromonas sp. KUL49]
MNTPTILLVEDDEDIAEIVIMYMENANYKVHWMADGAHVVAWTKTNNPALILLDIDLPSKSGIDICKEVRDFSDVPIIMTTAKIEEVDRLLGLELGADDYVCKPYSTKELVARTKANLRRLNKIIPPKQTLILDSKDFSVKLGDIVVELTAVEFALFDLLFSNPNRIFNRNHIMDRVYRDYREINDRTVDSHIRNLRKKLKKLETEHELIRSIYGAGYKYEPVPQRS